jgi:hypothetical protein
MTQIFSGKNDIRIYKKIFKIKKTGFLTTKKIDCGIIGSKYVKDRI